MPKTRSSLSQTSGTSGSPKLPAAAWLLLFNKYAELVKDRAFINHAAPKKRIVDEVGYDVWSVGHGPSALINLRITPDANKVESAKVEVQRIQEDWAKLLQAMFAAKKELDRLVADMRAPEQIERAKVVHQNAVDDIETAKQRREICRQVIEGSVPIVYAIPVASLESFEMYETQIQGVQVEEEPRKLPDLRLPENFDEWADSRNPMAARENAAKAETEERELVQV